jgi:hypothetical protein
MHLPLVVPVDHWVDRCVDRWAVASQRQARRNAMVAATALTQRRAEAREVEDYLASRGVRRTTADEPAPAALPR